MIASFILAYGRLSKVEWIHVVFGNFRSEKFFTWCNQLYAVYKVTKVISQEKVKQAVFTVISSDQGWGNVEDLSWIEIGILNSENKELIRRILLCDNERNLVESSLKMNIDDQAYRSFFDNLVEGNFIGVWGRCASPGWECLIEKFRGVFYVVNNS